MKYLYSLLIFYFLGAIQIYAANLPDGFVEQLLIDNLNPVAMTLDHHGNLWIVEKHGVVRVLDHEEGLLPDPFVQFPVDDYNERGLLGIALHPDFDNNPYVYLYYTVSGANHNRVSRFLANGNLAVPGSEEVILDMDPLVGYVHNGGALIFGPDGKLYIATGEAAHPPFSQDLNNLNGKILRLNPDGSIPNDNPFYQQSTGKYKSIWAYGLRNPFAFDIDPITGDFYCIDVGGGEYEEINHLIAGKNYGWPLIEGPRLAQQEPTNYQDPIYAYDHDQGCSIVGAAFNRLDSTQFPAEYSGNFFFADYCDGYIKSYDPQSGQIRNFADQINRPLAISFDAEHGKMYYLTRAGLGGGSPADNTSTSQGQLWEVSYVGDGAPFISIHPQDVYIPLGENAKFKIQSSGQRPFSYQWIENGQIIPAANQPELIVYAPTLADSGSIYQCIVSNSVGNDTSQSALLKVTLNQRPVVIIDTPLLASTFRAGEEIRFSGRAFDSEEGQLAASQLEWLTVWHHDDHTHPGAGPFKEVADGFWLVPTVNETDTNVWYRLYLSATDSQGLSNSDYIDIQPELTDIKLDGPEGVEINIDGRIRKLPTQIKSVIGLERVIAALPSFIVGDELYLFKNWSDGSTNLIWKENIPEEGLQLSLVYEQFKLGNGKGLRGEYFIDSLADFTSVPVFERIDTTLNFLWGNTSPDEDILGADFFSIRWEGEIQAVFDEIYTFHTFSDDGVRLWIGDELLIDEWNPQPPSEFQADKWLEAGKRYPIKVEYFEKNGGAEMILSWSSPITFKEVIPKRQLYPETEILPARISGEVWLDKNKNQFRENDEPPLAGIPILLKRKIDSSVVASQFSDDLGQFHFWDITPDTYFLQALPSADDRFLSGLGAIDHLGRSPSISPESGEILFLSLPFQEVDHSFFEAFLEVKLYPNPATEFLHLQFTLLIAEQLELEILGLQGQRLMSYELEGKLGRQNLEINLQNIPAGVYILRLENSRGSENRKIVKF